VIIAITFLSIIATYSSPTTQMMTPTTPTMQKTTRKRWSLGVGVVDKLWISIE
jgi:hypothetical protein